MPPSTTKSPDAAKVRGPKPAKGSKGRRSTHSKLAIPASALVLPATPPALSSAIRVEVTSGAVEIWSSELFNDPSTDHGRAFLARVFSLTEITGVEINRKQGVGRLCYDTSTAVAGVLRKLKEALVPLAASPQPRRRAKPVPEIRATTTSVDALFLRPPTNSRIRVTKVGSALSTWQVRPQGEGKVRLSHPILRWRKDIAHRLEDELTTILGVRDFKINRLTASVTVHFNPRRLKLPRLLRCLEQAWPLLLNGRDTPPPDTRMLASASLLSLAFTAQYFLPPLTPFVLLGIVAYGFTNVVSATKLLLRGKVGLPTLYTGTLTFTVLSGMPFSASLMATFMQFWPRAAFRTLTHSRRRLFANYLQRATWARLISEDGLESEIEIDSLRPGDTIIVYKGETIPVDGFIETGLAAIEEEALSGKAGALDKGPGDVVFAATFVKDGQITVRVTRVGRETIAGHIGMHVPRGRIDHLPASSEAEHVAMNMVTPALALSGLNLLVTGDIVASQTTIRPDYATAPRFSAQLAALHELSDSLRRGILFRHSAALSRLPATDIYVFDDAPALERHRCEVGEIITSLGVSSTEVLSYVTSAFPSYQNERARALMEESIRERVPLLEIGQRTRSAGVIRYRDEQHRQVEICTPAYVAAESFPVPTELSRAVAASTSAWDWEKTSGAKRKRPVMHADPPLRPLWVLRDGKILGVVTFQRKGELEAVEVIATLRARNANARFVHISSRPQAEAEALAAQIGIETVHGGLDAEGKAAVLTALGRRTMWIGDGTGPDAFLCVQASTVSISLAGAANLADDLASIVLLQSSVRGLVPLRRIGRRHRVLLKDTYRAVFAANLFCVAGALFGGFTTLTAALISNSATGYVYLNQRRTLNELAARIEAKMSKDLYQEPDEEELHDDEVSVAIDDEEPQEEFLEEDLDGPIAQELPI